MVAHILTASNSPARFVLTGPTGWIGRALLALLHTAGDPDALAPGESVTLFGSRAGTVCLPGGTDLSVRPLAEIQSDDVVGAHLIHLAYLTKDKLNQMGAEEFRQANTAIDLAVTAAIEASHPASIFVASSGAARQAQNGCDASHYGLAKLEQEKRFLTFGRTSGVAVLCGRIFNLAGPHINKLQDYAISNFALQALDGGSIKIDADHPVFRSFLHVEDLCRMILRAARRRIGDERPVDFCGMEVLEIQDIALRVAKEFGTRTKIERPAMSFSRRSDYVGEPIDTRILAMRLGLCLKDFADQLRDTADWIRAVRVLSATQAESEDIDKYGHFAGSN